MSHPDDIIKVAEEEIQCMEFKTANREPLPSGYFALVPLTSNYNYDETNPRSCASSYPPSESTKTDSEKITAEAKPGQSS